MGTFDACVYLQEYGEVAAAADCQGLGRPKLKVVVSLIAHRAPPPPRHPVRLWQHLRRQHSVSCRHAALRSHCFTWHLLLVGSSEKAHAWSWKTKVSPVP
jgi:hypothetical protein